MYRVSDLTAVAGFLIWFVHYPLHLSDLYWLLLTGWGQTEQWLCVSEKLVKPASARVQEPWGDEEVLAPGVGLLCHIHLQHLRLPQSNSPFAFFWDFETPPPRFYCRFLTFYTWLFDFVLTTFGASSYLGEQHADAGFSPSCVRLSDDTSPTWCFVKWRGSKNWSTLGKKKSTFFHQLLHWSPYFPAPGGLSGSAVASDRRAARERKQTADGRAFLPAARWIPAAGRPQLHVPPAAAGAPGVSSWRMVAQHHRRQVLLQWNCRVGLF